MNSTAMRQHATPLDVRSGVALSLWLAKGATVRCLSGQVWLTQQDDPRDYCFPAGVAFCADRTGHAVLTAMNGDARVRVYAPGTAPRPVVPGTVSIDSVEVLTRSARGAQAAFMGKVVGRFVRWCARMGQGALRAGRAVRGKRQAAC